ncbi:MAG: hypothetical protein ABSH47_12330 [Bryobacteraceae bacterium]|jgi:hypothetical protein
MLELVSLASALAIGILLAGAANPVRGAHPRWAALLFQVSLGAGAGIAITSIVFLFLTVSGIATPAVIFGADAILLAVSAALFARARRMQAGRPAPNATTFTFHWTWVLAIAFGLALLIVFSRLVSMVEANPWGQWDALAIWNLRAKFLAGPVGSWRVPVGGLLADRMHPDYPLLLSSFIARVWKWSGQMSTLAPIATSFLFFGAVIALLTSTVALLRGTASALLAGLVILATTSLLLLAPAQYSDIPLSFYWLAAVALILISESTSRSALLWAGLSAGFGAWTKNEGVVFLGWLLLVFCVLVWWKQGRKEALRGAGLLVAGALPGILLTLWLKFVIAPPADTLVQQTTSALVAKLLNAGRYAQIAKSFADETIHLGTGMTHPLILLAVLAFVLRWRVDERRRLPIAVSAIALGLMFLSDIAVYVITPSDLAWHLGTSFGRLILQLWPGVLLLCFAVMGSVANPPASVPPPALSKKKRKRVG